MHSTASHGIDPKVWGPSAWHFLHLTASVAHTMDDRKRFVAYINTFATIIPCQLCKDHFAKNRQNFDIKNHLESAESMLMWTFLMHDAVNFAQGKKGSQRPSWLEIRAKYFNVDNTDKNATPGSSEDYDSTLCTEICGATISKIREESLKTNAQEMKLKISARKKQTSKR
jgi:hypothetical protein